MQFKVDTDASTSYHLDIYRLGYYGGSGARKVATVHPSAALPQSQPDCLSQSGDRPRRLRQLGVSRLVGCARRRGLRHLLRQARARRRVPARRATSCSSSATTTARSTCSSRPPTRPGRPTTSTAATASTSARPPAARTRSATTARSRRAPYAPEDWVFNAEYPMVRWLERNGYDVSYSTGVDTDRRGAELLEHKAFLSVGHDEYWSGEQRSNVEAARAAGVNLAFFSGNEVFWKTRWEPSIDGSTSTSTGRSSTYKETHANAKIDPAAERLDRHVARSALQPTGGRRPSPRTRSPGRSSRSTPAAILGDRGACGRRQDALLAQHRRRDPGARRRPRRCQLGRWATSGTRTSTTALARRALPPVVHDVAGTQPVLQDYGSTYASGTATHN